MSINSAPSTALGSSVASSRVRKRLRLIGNAAAYPSTVAYDALSAS
ncbi:hypothetical protein BH11PSE13_BH11PSE13_06030 [soil metagenome]